MNKFSIGLGAAAGLVTTILLAVSMFDLLLGQCFYEQGCGPNEKVMVVGILLTAVFAGICVGWGAARLSKLILKRR